MGKLTIEVKHREETRDEFVEFKLGVTWRGSGCRLGCLSEHRSARWFGVRYLVSYRLRRGGRIGERFRLVLLAITRITEAISIGIFMN